MEIAYIMSPHGNIEAEIAKQGEHCWGHTQNGIVIDELRKIGDVHILSTNHYTESSLKQYSLNLAWFECGPSLQNINKVPSCWWHLNYDNMWWNTSNNKAKRIIIKYLEARAHKKFNSFSIATNEIAETFPHINDRTIPYVKGVDTSVFNPDATPNEYNNSKIIAWIGRFHDVKNPRRMIQAYKNMRDKTWRLEMVGDGPQLAECMENCVGMKNVVFHGQRDIFYVRDLLKRASLYVLSSDYDASPKTIIEAMCMGVPIVATDVGGVSDLLKGYDGAMTCHPDNLLVCMEDAIKHPVTHEAAKSGKDARERHDLRKQVKKTIESIMEKMK